MKQLFRFLNLELISFLDKKEKKQFFLLIMLMCIFGVVEAFTYSIIIPYLNVVIDPQRIFSITQLKPIFELFSIKTPLQIVFLISGIFILLFTFKTILHFSVTYFGAKIPNNISNNYTNKLFSSILTMPYESYIKKNTNNLLKHLTHNTQIIATIINSYLLYLSQIITCIFLIILLLFKNTFFSFIIFTYFLLIGSFLYNLIKIRQKKAGKMFEKYNEQFYKQSSESLSLFKDITLYNKFDYSINKNNYLSQIIFGTRKVQSFLSTLPGISLEYIVIITLVVFIYFSTKQIGNIANFGTLFIFYGVVGRRLLSCMGQIINLKNNINYFTPTIISFIKELDNINSVKKIKQYQTINDFSEINLKKISFYYKKSRPLLTDISINIRKHEYIGIIGHSGNGKSTLIDILLSFLTPKSGEIFINNTKYDNATALKSIISHVPQTITIFDDTITHNITLDNKNINIVKLKEVIQIASLDTLIDSLENGLETKLGDRGIKLSGGQKQRIAIARALYQNPQILIFDEATASLDAVSEAIITKSIENLKGKLTVISIAHRLSTIKNCDRIYLIDNGRIISSGNHKSLLNSCDEYKEFVNLSKI